VQGSTPFAQTRKRQLTQIVLDVSKIREEGCGALVATGEELPADHPFASLEFGWKPNVI
jgi:hypothetical protein